MWGSPAWPISLNLHESNEILLKTEAISQQIPYSYAGNAYNAFTRGLRDIELVRICSLWGSPDYDAFTILTVVNLFDNPDVIEHMARQIAEHLYEIRKSRDLMNTTKSTELSFGRLWRKWPIGSGVRSTIGFVAPSQNTIYLARTVTLKVKFSGFQQITRSRTLIGYVESLGSA